MDDDDKRYTISAHATSNFAFAIHDHRDLQQVGRVIARCDTMHDALRVQRALNNEYTLSMQCGPVLLRQKRTVEQ